MKDDFFKEILEDTVKFTTSKWILERVPYIFNGDMDAYIKWKEHLSSLIGVDSRAIALTGSSCVGFSLNPHKNFSDFQNSSDIDIAIISNHYFDIAWHYLRNIGAKYHRLSQIEKNSIDDHRGRLIYYGTIATDKIVHLLPFGELWINAMQQMMNFEPTKDRDINFRIYKDFEALKDYQSIGISKARDFLLKN
ncbi:hypothetical protein [Chryseobacterium indoltheticum]|uniref:hypothetical protein n=1 Tax=Chryseobacterium indoltheticum TaxID=254 RepID=UPI001911F2E0|nr:hypothetical protein [Chryseobacterium indoltheticum]QQQ29612.1 hypothetical protein JJL46_06260 [Chryseobacterium indoltheticum]